MVSVVMKQGTPMVRIELEGTQRNLIVDTISNDSILQPGMSRRDVIGTTTRPYGVTREVLDIKGLQAFTFLLNGREFTHAFLVCTLPADSGVLLGTDFLKRQVP